MVLMQTKTFTQNGQLTLAHVQKRHFLVSMFSRFPCTGYVDWKDETSSIKTTSWFRKSRIILCFEVIYANLKEVTQLASATLRSNCILLQWAQILFSLESNKDHKSHSPCFQLLGNTNWLGGKGEIQTRMKFQKKLHHRKAQTHGIILANSIIYSYQALLTWLFTQYYVAEEQQ